MIRNYYYNKQFKKYILGFSNIFAGMQVHAGIDDSGNTIVMDVPIRYGSTDRVTAAIATANTQNKLHTLPMIASYMTGLELAPDRLHGVNQVDRRTYLEQGGVFPDDVKAIRRVMAIPYNMVMELAVFASNTDQMFQILEQILMLFDYDLQLQFNDSPFDWTKISKLTLTGINNEENYPAGIDQRMIVWTMTFEMPVWLSPPVDIRQDLIQHIAVRIGDIAALTLNEIDQNGDLVPFGDEGPLTQIDIAAIRHEDIIPANPGIVQHATPGGVEVSGTGVSELVVGQKYDPSLDASCGKPQNPITTTLTNP